MSTSLSTKLQNIKDLIADPQALAMKNHPLAQNLPAPALHRLEDLRRISNQLHAPVDALTEELRKLRTELDSEISGAAKWAAAARRVMSRDDLAIEVENRKATAESIKQQISNTQARLAAAELIWGSAAGLLSACERYARSLEVKPALFKPVRFGSVDPMLAARKAADTIASLKAERTRAIKAPWPSALIKAEFVAQVEDAAQQSKPNVMLAIENGLSVEFPSVPLPGGGGGKTPRISFAIDAFGLVAFLFKDHLIEKTSLEIEKFADDDNALSKSERTERIAAIDKDILSVEREFEAAILAAGPSGYALRTRAQDPRAVLGLSDDAPAPIKLNEPWQRRG